MGSDSERKEQKKKKCKAKNLDHAVSDSSENVNSPVAPFSADILSPTAPDGDSVVINGESSTVGHEYSDPIMDEALETFKAVNRKQLGAFMQSFSKFIDAGGKMSAVIPPSDQASVTAIDSPEGSSSAHVIETPEGSSSAHVECLKSVTTGRQSFKHKNFDPLLLRDLHSTFRDSKDTKGHNKAKVSAHRKESVARSSSPSSMNDPNESDAYTTVSNSMDQYF